MERQLPKLVDDQIGNLLRQEEVLADYAARTINILLQNLHPGETYKLYRSPDDPDGMIEPLQFIIVSDDGETKTHEVIRDLYFHDGSWRVSTTELRYDYEVERELLYGQKIQIIERLLELYFTE